MEEAPKVKPDTMRFDELMLKIRNGQLRIPDFQREFVWDIDQIVNLLDSVYNHYPIGSFLFWQTKDEIQSYRRVGEIELRHDQESSVQYVLDGQQRLTSLFASLEQASIAHRVNGKKVTKSVQVYFDLDERVFVANPFDQEKPNTPNKRKTFSFVPEETDYLRFLKQLLLMIDEKQPTWEQSVAWLASHPGIARSRARRIHGQTRDMGLYVETENCCSLTERGRSFLRNCSATETLALLVETVEYFEELLPRLVDGEVNAANIADLLTKQTGDEIKDHKVMSRLKWLAGIGLGHLAGSRFILGESGRDAIQQLSRRRTSLDTDRRHREDEQKKRYFSVRQITDINRFVETAASLDTKRREELNRVLRRFTSYPFSVIGVFEQPIQTACEIFERINNSGKILNVVDLMVAKSWSHTFNLRERLNEFRGELEKEYYDSIPDITIIQCLSAIVQRGVSRKDILNIERSAVEANWETTLENVRRAVDFLRSNLRISHAKILPYNASVVPLAFYFFECEVKAHDDSRRKRLEQWFWRASVSRRYDQAAETKLAEDIERMADLAAGRDVTFDYVAPALSADRIVSQKLDLGSAFCKTLLCAMNSHGPREFKDSSPVSLTSFSKFNAGELHHVFPQGYLRKHDGENYSERDSIANIALASASANKQYGSKPPSQYLAESKNPSLKEVLRSHLVPEPDVSGLLEDDFDAFVQYRAGEILKVIRKVTGEMAEVEADLTEDERVALDKFERRLREFIDLTLRARNPGYWQFTGADDFREKIEQRISLWLNESPGRGRRDVREIDFCQIFDYFKIIKAHWPVFENVFKSKSDLEQYFKILSNFRNASAHNRDSDEATRQLALGALMWFDKALVGIEPVHNSVYGRARAVEIGPS